jgi:hypothetical protein
MTRAAEQMTTTRRPPRTKKPKYKKATPVGKIADFRPSKIPPERLEAFRLAYIESHGNATKAGRAIGMAPSTAKKKAWLYVRALNLKVADALAILGRDATSQAQKLAALQEAKTVKWNPFEEDWDVFEDSSIQLAATVEIGKLRDDYPARKEPPPDQGPVVVIFDTDITVHEREIYASHTIEQQGSFPDQPQGNVGSGTPEGTIAGSSLLDAAESREEQANK